MKKILFIFLIAATFLSGCSCSCDEKRELKMKGKDAIVVYGYSSEQEGKMITFYSTKKDQTDEKNKYSVPTDDVEYSRELPDDKPKD